MIEVERLTRRFGRTEAVRGVTFTVRPGEIVGYLGPNGAGKSTTVRMIVGILQPCEGLIRVCGYDVAAQPLEVKRRIGYVPEDGALYPSLTPNEYLSLVAELHHLPPDVAGERIKQLLDAFQIADVANQRIAALSRGTRQKVVLISALMHNPDVAVLDEPLTGLDVNAVIAFCGILKEMAARGKTVLYCSHILDVVERLCSRVIVIDHGRIVADDSTSHLLATAPDATLQSVFQSLTRRGETTEAIQTFLDTMDS